MANIRPLSAELSAKAHNELNEVTDRIPDDIAAIRTWIEKQPHLNSRIDDQFLVTFLRGSKYSLEKTKRKIDYYYTIRSISPELFLHKPVDDRALKLANLGAFIPLPKPFKPDGPRLQINRYGIDGLREFDTVDFAKHQLRIFDIQLHEDDNCAISGVINIADMSNTPLSFLLKFDQILMKKTSIYFEEGLAFDIEEIHVINPPAEVIPLINLTQSLMPKRVKDKMNVHTSMESFFEKIPQEYLPEEYGGNNGNLQELTDIWVKKMLDYKEFFEDDCQYGADEKLRIGTPMTTNSLFGLEGSFRELEVD